MTTPIRRIRRGARKPRFCAICGSRIGSIEAWFGEPIRCRPWELHYHLTCWQGLVRVDLLTDQKRVVTPLTWG